MTLKNQHIESSPAEDKQLNGEKDTQEQTKSYKAGVVSLDNKYNEKFVQSHTDSLPLEDEVKKKYTPNSFLSRTSSVASIHSLNRQKIVKVGS